MNQTILIGNIGNDPEIKTLNDGREVANMSLATTEYWRDESGNRSEKTTWHMVQTFRPGLVDVIRKFVKKGSKICVSGSYLSSSYVDKENNKRTMFYVRIDSMELLSPKNPS